MAGYSNTPLYKKLGIKEGLQVLLLNAPAEYPQWLGADCPAYNRAREGETDIDMVHIFTNSTQQLEDELIKLKKVIKPTGMVWISWYKKASKKPTEITEDFIREIALPQQWVDVKVCAVSEDWSGLKLVIPLKYR